MSPKCEEGRPDQGVAAVQGDPGGQCGSLCCYCERKETLLIWLRYSFYSLRFHARHSQTLTVPPVS